MMKLSVVLFVALVASVCYAQASDAENAEEKKPNQIHKTCLDKMNTTMEELESFARENKPHPKLHCLNGCLFVEYHQVKQNGSVNKRVVEQQAKEVERQKGKAAAEAFRKCFNFKRGLSLCDIGRVVGSCLVKATAEFGT